MSDFDVIVIGAGPGGYSCAIRCSQLGLKVAIVEKGKLGGVCTNIGCIPTKALYASAKLARKLKSAKQFGIEIESYKLDFTKALSRANRISKNLAKGIELLLKNNNVEIINGFGKITKENTVEVDGKEITAKNIVLATGSHPIELPFAKFNKKDIISSEDFFSMEDTPGSVVIVGGGYEGCEFANILNAFGVKVTIVELAERLLPREDKDVGEFIVKVFERNGIECLIGKKVVEIQNGTVTLESGEKLQAEKILVVVGRRANSNETFEVTRTGVETNDYCKTKMESVYAIGDAAGGMTAHVASFQGELVAENIVNDEKQKFDRNDIPNAIFTDPEIAAVGNCSIDGNTKIGKFPFVASGKAATAGEKLGFVKVFVRENVLVGCIIVNSNASSLIAEATLAIKNKLTVEQITSTVHAHPTFPEGFLEAIKDVNKESIYLPK